MRLPGTCFPRATRASHRGCTGTTRDKTPVVRESERRDTLLHASISTWLGYDTPVAFSISYYTRGAVLGALLDLSILHDTHGSRGLDDVMRALYVQSYMKGKGFTPNDMLLTFIEVARRDYSAFFDRCATGVEVPPERGRIDCSR